MGFQDINHRRICGHLAAYPSLPLILQSQSVGILAFANEEVVSIDLEESPPVPTLPNLSEEVLCQALALKLNTRPISLALADSPAKIF